MLDFFDEAKAVFLENYWIFGGALLTWFLYFIVSDSMYTRTNTRGRPQTIIAVVFYDLLVCLMLEGSKKLIELTYRICGNNHHTFLDQDHARRALEGCIDNVKANINVSMIAATSTIAVDCTTRFA